MSGGPPIRVKSGRSDVLGGIGTTDKKTDLIKKVKIPEIILGRKDKWTIT